MRDSVPHGVDRDRAGWHAETAATRRSRVTVVDGVAAALADAGVGRLYGVIGESLGSLGDAVRARRDITWLPLRSEAAAVSAATAEARLTARLTVCAGNRGSGSFRLLDRLHDAHRHRVPLLAIAMHASTREIGAGDDDVRPESLFQHCSGFCELVSHSHQMPRLLRRAVETAIARPGVAVLVLPADVALRSATTPQPSHGLRACVAASSQSSAAECLPGSLLVVADSVAADASMAALWRRLSDATRQVAGPIVISASDTTLSHALGAQLSHPDRLVFALVDDSALATLAGDLSTFHELRAPVKVIVTRSGPVRTPQCEGVFAMVADATGALGLVARSAAETCRTLDRIIAHDGPALVEVFAEGAARQDF